MTDTNTAALKAFCKAQQAMTSAMKDTNNEFFKSKYADLGAVQDACFPALHSNGFSVMHQIRNEDSGSVLDTILLHESGASWTCPVPLLVGKNDMQGLGSAITYARRYGLMCLSGVAPEDDDGNKAAENKPKNRADRVGARDKPPAEDKPVDPFEATADDIQREIKKIGTITDIDELASYWAALKKAQTSVARHADVIAAKDALKAMFTAEFTGSA